MNHSFIYKHMYFVSKHIICIFNTCLSIYAYGTNVFLEKMFTVFFFDLMKGGAEDSSLSNVLTVANKELIEIARRSDASVLRQRLYDGLSSEDWMSDISKEMATRCPVVNEIISSLLECNIYPDRKKPAVCLIYGIMMFLRCHELSRIQRINSVLLIQGQASANVSN